MPSTIVQLGEREDKLLKEFMQQNNIQSKADAIVKLIQALNHENN